MPISDNISDLWWLKPPPAVEHAGELFLRGMEIGQRHRESAYALREQQININAQRLQLAMDVQMAKQRAEFARTQGLTQMGVHLANVADKNLWTDPNARAEAWRIGSQSPSVFDHNTMMGIDKSFQDAIDRKQKADEFMQTGHSKDLDLANKKEQEASQLELQGKTDEAKQARQDAALLRSTLTAPTETIETYTDEAGKQQFRIVRGPTNATDKGPLTTATKSQVQQRLLAADKMTQMGVGLLNNLKFADVGVAGNINQVAINEGLAQFFPGLTVGGTTEARTLLGTFNEQAIKAIASDPRISDKDRARYERILPKLSPLESVTSAKTKIATFLQQFRMQARADAQAAGIEPPIWSLSREEIRDKVKAGEISTDDAVQALIKYFP